MALYEDCVDVVGKLIERNIVSIVDKIFLLLDWHSLKNASLVSKSWRKVALVTFKTIATRSNPNWNVKQRSLWKKIRSHLRDEFRISAEEPSFHQRFANSLHLVLERLQKGCWPNLDLTLDYLPINYEGGVTCDELELESHFEINEKFIVVWDTMTELLYYWSRRTLLPLKMDPEFQMRKYPVELGGVGMNFKLSGNCLIYGEIFTRGDCDVIDITRVDLDSKCRGIGEPTMKIVRSALVAPSSVNDEDHFTLIRHIGVDEDFILLMFLFGSDESKFNVSVLWKMEEAEDTIDLRSALLQVPSLELKRNLHCFFDSNYLVAQWSDEPAVLRCGFRTYSLHPAKAGGPVELRRKASFEVVDAVDVVYKNGLLVSASDIGDLTFVDVSKGDVLMVISSLINFGWKGSKIRMTQDYLVCSQMCEPFLRRGTFFFVWDLPSLMIRQAAKGVKFREWIKPDYVFKTLTGKLLDFKVDELGIAAAMENEPERGIQVLSFLPACNGCKRVTRPALLKRCSRCKSVTYCSRECQAADWNPHHKLICSKVDPLESAYDHLAQLRMRCPY